MKKQLLAILLCIAAMLTLNTKSIAQSTLIHYWHFNNGSGSMSTTTGFVGVHADYSDLDTSKAKILYQEMPGVSSAYYTYMDYVGVVTVGPDFDTINARMGQPSGQALRARNPCDSMYVLFYLPTTHFRNIKLTYAAEPSSIAHGPLTQIFDYSVDSGSNWRTSGLSIDSFAFLPSDTGSYMRRITVTFGSDSSVINNPRMVFRVHFTLPNDSFGTHGFGAQGNTRFDNVTLDGDTILSNPIWLGVNQINAAVAPEYTLYPNPVYNNLQISSNTEGEKSITIYNVVGKMVREGKYYGHDFEINTSEMNTGMYFITITETSTGAVTTKKFVKQ
jgi:hypothetical protein